MSEKIDVLAVMQIASDTCAAVARREGTAADLREARAAVADSEATRLLAQAGLATLGVVA